MEAERTPAVRTTRAGSTLTDQAVAMGTACTIKSRTWWMTRPTKWRTRRRTGEVFIAGGLRAWSVPMMNPAEADAIPRKTTRTVTWLKMPSVLPMEKMPVGIPKSRMW